MKTKKVIKKLTHAETLPAKVVEDFAGAGKGVLDAINSAKHDVEQVRLRVEKAREAEPKRTRVTVPRKSARSAAARHEVSAKTA